MEYANLLYDVVDYNNINESIISDKIINSVKTEKRTLINLSDEINDSKGVAVISYHWATALKDKGKIDNLKNAIKKYNKQEKEWKQNLEKIIRLDNSLKSKILLETCDTNSTAVTPMDGNNYQNLNMQHVRNEIAHLSDPALISKNLFVHHASSLLWWDKFTTNTTTGIEENLANMHLSYSLSDLTVIILSDSEEERISEIDGIQILNNRDSWFEHGKHEDKTSGQCMTNQELIAAEIFRKIIMNSSWYTRVWTVQEAVLPRHLFLLYKKSLLPIRLGLNKAILEFEPLFGKPLKAKTRTREDILEMMVGRDNYKGDNDVTAVYALLVDREQKNTIKKNGKIYFSKNRDYYDRGQMARSLVSLSSEIIDRAMKSGPAELKNAGHVIQDRLRDNIVRTHVKSSVILEAATVSDDENNCWRPIERGRFIETTESLDLVELEISTKGLKICKDLIVDDDARKEIYLVMSDIVVFREAVGDTFLVKMGSDFKMNYYIECAWSNDFGENHATLLKKIKVRKSDLRNDLTKVNVKQRVKDNFILGGFKGYKTLSKEQIDTICNVKSLKYT